MMILLNGQPVETGKEKRPTLQSLLELRELRADRVAVEWNGEIVPRALWPVTELQAGDRIEVVHFVGGGKSEQACRAR